MSSGWQQRPVLEELLLPATSQVEKALTATAILVSTALVGLALPPIASVFKHRWEAGVVRETSATYGPSPTPSTSVLPVAEVRNIRFS